MKRKKIILIIGLIIMGIAFASYKYDFFNRPINNTIESKDDEKEDTLINCSELKGKSQVIKSNGASLNVLSLCFEGMQDDNTMQEILELLDSYNVKSTFIVSGIDAAENPEILKEIDDSGHEIGSGGLSNEDKQMENVEQKELVRRFSKSNNIIGNIIDKKVNLLKCKNTEYTDEVLEASYASGDDYVLDNSNYISYQSFKNYEQAKNYIRNSKENNIISIKLNGVLDEDEYKKSENDENTSKDKRIGIKDKDLEKEDEVNIVQVVKWILESIKEEEKSAVKVTDLLGIKNIETANNQAYNINTLENKFIQNNTIQNSIQRVNFPNRNNSKKQTQKMSIKKTQNKDINIPKVNFQNLIEKNARNKSEVNSEIYTTENAVSYTFRGINNEEALNAVLDTLNKLNAKGTFFVTKDEIEQYPERINKILSYGNEIGNGGITSSSKLKTMSTEDICNEIYEVDALLKNMGIKTDKYMPGYGYSEDNIREAMSSLRNLDEFSNYRLFTYTKTPIISKYSEWSAEDILKDYFNTNTYLSLRKGEIVYFRLDSRLFSKNDTIANLIELLTNRYVSNGYINKYNKDNGTYDLVQKHLGYSVVPLKNLINDKEYKLLNISKKLNIRNEEDAKALINKNYIGNQFVDLDGFLEEEKKLIDKEGTINTKGESTIFFTFDDWGSDVIVNEILDVLRKHNVKATFFVIGKYIDKDSDITNKNPNLLRTIALEGHDIGSHTYNHDIMSMDKESLGNSLIKSYDAMSHVIGDLDSLKPYFRPPTLYVDKEGLTESYRCGYNYVVNGNISTHDYEASSSEELLSNIENELIPNKGNVVVMHMNNQAYYTAEALDKFLTKNENGLYKEKYKISKLSDCLK